MAVLEYKKEGKIATFTINRPEAYNAVDPEVAEEFSRALIDFRDDDSLWVGIVTGAGNKAFCAGADIRSMLPYLAKNKGKPWKTPPMITFGLELWKPLVAAINGVALGTGLEFCMACDVRVAVESARLGLPEVTLGMVPAMGGTQRLARLVPFGIAAEMLLTGKHIDAQEAYRIGLVNKVVPASELMSAAKEMAEALCKPGPLAVRAAKKAMYQGTSLGLEEALRLELMCVDTIYGSEDFKEGITAFADKRKPEYKAK